MKKDNIFLILFFVFMISYLLFINIVSIDPIQEKARDIPASSNNFDESLLDILPSQPESRGDIPQLVSLLRQAKDSKDIKICDTLPTPQKQYFWFDDYYDNSPTLMQWKKYCEALVSEDPLLCQKIDRGNHPALKQECILVLEKILLKKNNSYTFCYDNYGSLYTSSDQVRNCMIKYEYENAPKFYQDLSICLELSDKNVNYIGSKRGECLYNLAQSSKDSKICDLINIPYPGYKYSVPNCKTALGE